VSALLASAASRRERAEIHTDRQDYFRDDGQKRKLPSKTGEHNKVDIFSHRQETVCASAKVVESPKPLLASPRWPPLRLLAMSVAITLIVGAGAYFSRWVVTFEALNPRLWKWGHPVFMLLLIGSLIYAFLRHVNPERRRAEEGKRAQLASIVESSDDAIIGKTLDGIVTAWNKAAERMFSYTAAEMIGKPASILFPSDRAQEEGCILSQIRQGEKVPLHDSARVAKDGHVVNVGVTVSPILDGKGNIIGASTIARDLTQVKMAEQALRNTEKLAVAGRMAATVAHEINGPLEAVANMLFLLDRTDLADTVPPQCQQCFKIVRSAQEEIKRIGQITKLTLGFHREGERGEAELRASDLIDGILALYGHRSESQGVAIEKRYDSAGALVADAGELRQVFSNLIVNAAEALANKGDKLVIHVCDSQDWRGTGRKGVRITIADNGSGIPREVRHKLFEPFFTTKREKGTGLGLWVTKSLVDKQDGSLRVRSTPGLGTAFSIFPPSNTANTKVA
jgi:two-component system, chemotaxis family, CheB/CheR fusion protein